jgi:hypothetical protein
MQTDLKADIRRLNCLDGMLYRSTLTCMLATHGRDAVVRAMCSSYDGNIVSIASARKWYRPRGWTPAKVAR